nr:MAG TPA: hypothetical protein [Caudoviricetes sp.]
MSKNSILPLFISNLWLFLSIFGPKLSILPVILSIFRYFLKNKNPRLSSRAEPGRYNEINGLEHFSHVRFIFYNKNFCLSRKIFIF